MQDPPSLVLATDLDGTFLGGDPAQRRALYDEVSRRRDELVLIFVTGRDLDFVAELGTRPGLPEPDLVIGDVGTTIVHGHDHSPLAEVQAWVDGRWDGSNDAVLALLKGESGLELQPVMGERRVSYYYEPATLHPSMISRIERAGYDVIASAGRFLDVLPRGVAKGPTLARSIDVLGLPPDAVLVAGDTLNDLSLFQTGFRGVTVGNAEPALIDAVAGRPGVHQSHLPGCAGITDAIEHFGYFSSGPASVAHRPSKGQHP